MSSKMPGIGLADYAGIILSIMVFQTGELLYEAHVSVHICTRWTACLLYAAIEAIHFAFVELQLFTVYCTGSSTGTRFTPHSTT